MERETGPASPATSDVAQECRPSQTKYRAPMVGTPRGQIEGGPVMLVLSRGRNDKVVFPTLGISVEILRVAGNKVRLGIDAPHEIPVHRHEVSERMEAHGECDTIRFPSSSNSAAAKLTHDMRNRL